MGSVHNELRSVSQLQKAYQRAFGLDQEAGVERLGETLTPILDLWSDPSWAYLRGEKLCAASLAFVAVAGEISAIALFNPAGSQMLLTVDAVNYRPIAAALTAYLARATQAAIEGTLTVTTVGEFARDTRWPIASPGVECVGRVYGGSDPAAIGSLIEFAEGAANTVQPFRSLPWVLSPGWGIVVQRAAISLDLTAHFYWRERRALPGELTS